MNGDYKVFSFALCFVLATPAVCVCLPREDASEALPAIRARALPTLSVWLLMMLYGATILGSRCSISSLWTLK